MIPHCSVYIYIRIAYLKNKIGPYAVRKTFFILEVGGYKKFY